MSHLEASLAVADESLVRERASRNIVETELVRVKQDLDHARRELVQQISEMNAEMIVSLFLYLVAPFHTFVYFHVEETGSNQFTGEPAVNKVATRHSYPGGGGWRQNRVGAKAPGAHRKFNCQTSFGGDGDW